MKFLQKLSQRLVNTMSKKIVNSSAERNKKHILEILTKYFQKVTPGNVLEISSGTGQHVSYIAPNFPYLTFQPSEYDFNMIPQIKLYIDDCPSKNIKKPLHIDITDPIEKWGLDTHEFDYIFNINMIHITPFNCTQSLFKKAGTLLVKDGLLITYGPYGVNGQLFPQSNVNFDKFLREQDPEWGVRDIGELELEAKKNGIVLNEVHEMPSNNKCLIWKKL